MALRRCGRETRSPRPRNGGAAGGRLARGVRRLAFGVWAEVFQGAIIALGGSTAMTEVVLWSPALTGGRLAGARTRSPKSLLRVRYISGRAGPPITRAGRTRVG